MKSLFALLLFSVSAFAQMPLGGITFQPVSGSCTLPADVIYQYTGWNASNLCGTTGGSSCTTNAQAFFSFADSVGGNTASQSTTTAQGTYTTGALNGLAGVTFNGSSDFYPTTTTVPAANVIYTFHFVFQPSTTGVAMTLAGRAANGGLGATESSTNHFQMAVTGGAAVGSGTTSLASGTMYAYLGTWNQTTGAYSIWIIAGGTATLEASGTHTATLTTSSWADIGGKFGASGDYFNGIIVEADFSESAPVAGNYATYDNCKYAH